MDNLTSVVSAIKGLWQPRLVEIGDEKTVISSGAYDAEDVTSESTSIGTPFIFKNAARVAGGGGRIIDAFVLAETTAIASWFSLFVHKSYPNCALNDDVANTAFLLRDRGNAVVQIDFPACSDLGTGMSASIVTPSTVGNLPKSFVCPKGSRDLYGVSVIRNAVDLVDNTILRYVLWIEQF